jgi:protein-tyrosine-phosphatase
MAMPLSRTDNPLLEHYPTRQKNVFLMMSFRKSRENQRIKKTIEKVLAEYDLQSLRAERSIEISLREWLVDLGIARRPREKLVLFMSYGGTCRCAMAKIVLRRALASRALPFNLRVESVAKTFGSTRGASKGAREIIAERYGKDLLKDHVVTRLCAGFVNDANLILPMDRKLCESISRKAQKKSHLFAQFFADKTKDISNPWRIESLHEPKEKRLKRYGECLDEIEKIINPNVGRIIDALNKQRDLD